MLNSTLRLIICFCSNGVENCLFKAASRTLLRNIRWWIQSNPTKLAILLMYVNITIHLPNTTIIYWNVYFKELEIIQWIIILPSSSQHSKAVQWPAVGVCLWEPSEIWPDITSPHVNSSWNLSNRQDMSRSRNHRSGSAEIYGGNRRPSWRIYARATLRCAPRTSTGRVDRE